MHYTVFERDTIGCYGDDSDGNPWSTFHMNNGVATCHECSATIDRGWARGKLGEHVYFCSEHVIYVSIKEQVDAEVARMDAKFAKLELIEDTYRKRFGAIPPITER